MTLELPAQLAAEAHGRKAHGGGEEVAWKGQKFCHRTVKFTTQPQMRHRSGEETLDTGHSWGGDSLRIWEKASTESSTKKDTWSTNWWQNFVCQPATKSAANIYRKEAKHKKEGLVNFAIMIISSIEYITWNTYPPKKGLNTKELTFEGKDRQQAGLGRLRLFRGRWPKIGPCPDSCLFPDSNREDSSPNWH